MDEKQAICNEALPSDEDLEQAEPQASGPYEQIRKQVAEQTGETPDHIRLVEMQLDMLLKAGVLVDIDGSGLSMFQIQTPWEIWGVPESSARRQHLTSGSLSVFPRDVVNKIRSKIQSAANALDKNPIHYGYRVPGLPGVWVPYTAYRTWLDDFNHRIADLNQYVQSAILDNYPDLVRGARRKLGNMAREAYNSLRALDNSIELDWQIEIDVSGIDLPNVKVGDMVKARGRWTEGGPDPSSESPSEDAPYRKFHADGIEVLGPEARYRESKTWIVGTVTRLGSGLENITLEEFEENVMDRIGRAIPTPDDIRGNVRLSYSTAALVNPSVVEAELAYRDEIHRMRDMACEAEHERQAEKDKQRRLEQEKEAAEKQQIWVQTRMVEMEAEHKRKQLEEMRQVEREHYRQQLAQMASPVMAIFNNLRAQMHEGAHAVLEALKSGRANGPAARKARNMVQAFRLLNGLEDDELDQLIGQADILVNQPQPTDKIDTRSLEGVMKDIVVLTAEAAAEVQIVAHKGGRWRGLRPAQL